MTDWETIHRDVVEKFRAGWSEPHPQAWDSFLDEDATFVQPMLRDGAGAALWREESARLLALLPDLHVDVLEWSGVEDTLFIHIRFVATLGGRPLSWTAVDLLRLSPEGTAVHRTSYFDSAPVAVQVLRRPRAWRSWWRSGVGRPRRAGSSPTGLTTSR
jgi:hypothetical protein